MSSTHGPWPDPRLLHHDHLPWELDATATGLPAADLAALPWATALAELASVEAGEPPWPEGPRRVAHYWLRAPEHAPTIAEAQALDAAHEAWRALADAVLSGSERTASGEAFTDVIQVGIGGSVVGAQLVLDALADDATGAPRGLVPHVLDNLDPAGWARLIGRLGPRLRRTLVIVSSRSGSTPEPLHALVALHDALAAQRVNPADHLVAITQPGSPLAERGHKERWRRVLAVPDGVGGRYATTSAATLLVAALAGVDTAAFLAGARAMDAWTSQREPLDNPAAVLAGTWFLARGPHGVRDLVVLPYADRLERLGRYIQAVVMESIGKQGDRAGRPVEAGLVVYGTKGSSDQHTLVQQLRDGRDEALVWFFEVLSTEAPDPAGEDGVSASARLQGMLLGTRRALAERGRPSLRLTLDRLDAYTLGGVVALVERAVGLHAALLGINPYDQPGVEAGKRAADDLLALHRSVLGALASGPASVADLADRLHADPGEVHALLRRAEASGLVAVTGSSVVGTWRLSAPAR